MAAVQRDPFGAVTVGTPIQLSDALQDQQKDDQETGSELLEGRRTRSDPFLPLHQLSRQVLMQLLLLHMRGFNLHAVLQHVDVVCLSVHCTHHNLQPTEKDTAV